MIMAQVFETRPQFRLNHQGYFLHNYNRNVLNPKRKSYQRLQNENPLTFAKLAHFCILCIFKYSLMFQ